MALSLVLLADAGLFVRTLHNLQKLDPGFIAQGVLLVDLEGRRSALPRPLLDDVQRLPGVMSASLSTHTPLSGAVWSEPAVPAGQPIPESDNAYFIGAGPGSSRPCRLPCCPDATFTGATRQMDPRWRSSTRCSRSAFANQNPVGQHLSAKVRGQHRDLEIVGLVRNTNAAGLRAAPPATVYVAYAQLTGDFPTTLAFARLVPSVRCLLPSSRRFNRGCPARRSKCVRFQRKWRRRSSRSG